MTTPGHGRFEAPRREGTAQRGAREPAPGSHEGAQVGAGVVFFAALLVIVLAWRRLRQRARVEEATAYLDEERGLSPASSAPGRDATPPRARTERRR